jgi:hypothetical protein
MQHDLCDVQHNRGTGEKLKGQAADAGYVVYVNRGQLDID